MLQVNVETMTSKLQEIDAKLQHERGKLGTFTADLQAFEQRHGLLGGSSCHSLRARCCLVLQIQCVRPAQAHSGEAGARCRSS